ESLPRLIRMNLVGGFYSLILPGEETGQLAKGVILARHSQGDAVAASIVVDEILGTLSVFSIALAALALTHPFPLRLPIATALAIMLAVFLVLLTLAVVPQFHHVARWLLARLPMPSSVRDRFVRWLEPFWDCLSDYHRHPLHLLAAFLITAAAHMLANLSVLSTMNAVGANVSYLDVCWIYAAISALVTIPITVSGFGVREGANVVILGQLGVTPSTSLAVSLLAFAIGFVWSVPGGVLQFGIRSKAEGRRAELPPEPLPVEAAATGASR
ncbi:MAG TPA: lysylphosphatidylglycerol synthase transmembrane domain-containing protein, partial [Chloroflexota bacterium]|nr:lysylphosphatidylglycerol synthase transmembrane domain-containing protein [Chloroflexota bacterium]